MRTRRRDGGRETVCGLHAVTEALRSAPEQVLELWLDEARDDQRVRAIAALAGSVGLRAQRASRPTLDRLAGGVPHQGALLRRRAQAAQSWEETLRRLDALQHGLLLALDGVEDPHNFGACLRSAAAAGVDTVLYPRSRGGTVNATVRRVASGGAELLELQAVANLARALEQLAAAGYDVLGLDGEASESLFEAHFGARVVLVAGAEGRGLRRLTREACTGLLAIPLAAGMQSLNVSVASGIALFAAREGQRRELSAAGAGPVAGPVAGGAGGQVNGPGAGGAGGHGL